MAMYSFIKCNYHKINKTRSQIHATFRDATKSAAVDHKANFLPISHFAFPSLAFRECTLHFADEGN